MKHLLVIRHAKSSWDSPVVSDFQRPLNERGNRDAPRMAKRLKEKNIVPDLMVSSPAVRALTTCEIIADGLGYPRKNIKTERNLYHADDETILKIIRSLPPKYDTVLIFGHNPGLTDFVNSLTTDFIPNVPTCGIVFCALPVESWAEVEWGKGKVRFFDFPKKYSGGRK